MAKELRGLFRSFRWALRGFCYCAASQRNFRIHLCAAGALVWWAAHYALERTQWALLLLAVGLMLAAEMLNTALEALTNLRSESYDSLARVAKDVAAGAVLVCAVLCAVVGFVLLWDMPVILSILGGLVSRPWELALVGLLTAGALVFIFWGPRSIRLFLRGRAK